MIDNNKLKPGRIVIDPLNRRVEVVRVEGEQVVVKLFGPYGATVSYPKSSLSDPEDVTLAIRNCV